MSWFTLAYILSLTILASFVVWIVVDCSFRWIPYIVGQDLRLRFLADPCLRKLHSWQIHGPRLLLFASLTLLGTVFAAVVFGMLFAGAEQPAGRILLAIGLIASALALVASWRFLRWRGFRFRIDRHLDAMRAAVATLSKHWPADRIVLPGLGSYEVAERYPNLLYIQGTCPDGLTDFGEAFDRISRNADGEFSFAVGSYPGWWIHCMTEGHVPRSSSGAVLGATVAWELQTTVPLAQGWYLAYYAISVKPGPSDVSSDSNHAQDVAAPGTRPLAGELGT
jgi:hypothetical protein